MEACRYLGNTLVESWDLHGSAPKLPPDEDLHTHARRLIASRCLYGVDKNPFAVDLAKLSLWLATLAKDHPFTFLDHSLRNGDSLVGLSREQIASFHWAPEKQVPLLGAFIDEAIKEALAKRAAIHALGDEGDTESKARLHDEAVDALGRDRAAEPLARLEERELERALALARQLDRAMSRGETADSAR